MKLLALAATLLLAASPTAAQQHGQHGGDHHHPPGVMIRMGGTIVEPVSHFIAASADAVDPQRSEGGAWESAGQALPPVLLGMDGKLYLLSPATSAAAEAVRSALGTSVAVSGTVFPAGSGYLIVVEGVEQVEERRH